MRTHDEPRTPAPTTSPLRDGAPPRRAVVRGAAALGAAALAGFGLVKGARGATAAQDGDGAAPQGAPASSAAPRLVVLLRHGETAAGGHGGDPELSDDGRRRAARLAALLAKAQPALLVASEYRRTQDTLAPLAAAVGAEVEVLSARDPKACVARLAGLPAGALAVVCGHSNTVPDLAKRLGVALEDLEQGPAGAQFASAEHGRIVICTLAEGAPAAAFELRY